MTAPLSYSLVTGKEIEFEKVSFIDTCQILCLLVNTLAANQKYFFLNRDNLRIAIEIQLFEKEKKLSEVFAAFWKLILNFELFE